MHNLEKITKGLIRNPEKKDPFLDFNQYLQTRSSK